MIYCSRKSRAFPASGATACNEGAGLTRSVRPRLSVYLLKPRLHSLRRCTSDQWEVRISRKKRAGCNSRRGDGRGGGKGWGGLAAAGWLYLWEVAVKLEYPHRNRYRGDRWIILQLMLVLTVMIFWNQHWFVPLVIWNLQRKQIRKFVFSYRIDGDIFVSNFSRIFQLHSQGEHILMISYSGHLHLTVSFACSVTKYLIYWLFWNFASQCSWF